MAPSPYGHPGFELPNNPYERGVLYRQLAMEHAMQYGGGVPPSHFIGADALFGADPYNPYMSGDGYPAYLGAAPMARAPMPMPFRPPGVNPAAVHAMVQQQIAAARNSPIPVKGGAVATTGQMAGSERERDLGFDSVTTIAAGASAPLVAKPDGFAFQGNRLTMSDTLADSFIITSWTIGGANQLAGGLAISCAQFKSVNTNRRNYAVCPAGNEINLVVTNTSGGALRFTATFTGMHVRAD